MTYTKINYKQITHLKVKAKSVISVKLDKKTCVTLVQFLRQDTKIETLKSLKRHC